MELKTFFLVKLPNFTKIIKMLAEILMCIIRKFVKFLVIVFNSKLQGTLYIYKNYKNFR